VWTGLSTPSSINHPKTLANHWYFPFSWIPNVITGYLAIANESWQMKFMIHLYGLLSIPKVNIVSGNRASFPKHQIFWGMGNGEWGMAAF